MNTSNSKATAALVLGIISLLAWLLPLAGFPVSIVGLILGVKSLNTEQKSNATVGMVLSIIGLVLCIINSAIGAYQGATRQLF